MEKWNFDEIFTGTNDEQECHASHFIGGAKRLRAAGEKDYASAILHHDFGHKDSPGDVLARIHEVEDAENALLADERFKALVARVEAREAESSKDRVKSMVMEALDKTFKR